MHVTTPGRETWRVGDLLVDVGQQRVLRGAEELRLPKLSFELLLTLTRRAPDVVSLDEIMESVWPGLVVSPETIVQRVRLLRVALGEDATEPQYIEALRSRGYRLVPRPERVDGATIPELAAPPTPLASALAPPAAPVPTASGRAAPRSRRRTLAVFYAAAAAALVAVAAVAAYAWLERPPAPAALATSTSDATFRTVAVLPFRSLSADPADAYLATGLPEVTLTRLATIRGLTVISRDSSRLAGPAWSAAEAGRRLGARYLVEGSVQRSGERLRVTARLVDARDESQLWSQTWDGELAAIYRLQDELADGVARTLEARLSGVELAKPRAEYGGNVDATLAYLRGRALLGRYTVAEAESAARQFERAIELDPNYGAAHAALYDARMQLAQLRFDDLPTARARNRPLLDRALALDPASGTAYFARAMWAGGTDAEREADFRKGAELSPSDGRGLLAWAEFLKQRQRPDEARRALAAALAVDPLSPRVNFRRAMWTFDESGADVERAMLQVLEIDPSFYPALQRYSKYRWQGHGEIARAIGLIERAIASDPDNPWGRYTAVAYYLDVGDPAAAKDVIANAPVGARAARALLALHAGDAEAAIAAALDGGARPFNTAESWGVPETLRDAALGAAADSAAERELRRRFIDDEGGGLNEFTFRPRLLLAQLALARGERERATAEIRQALAWTDANTRFGLQHRARATALMLLGETDAALRELATSFDEGDYRQWWYVLDRDPVWVAVRGDPRFRAIADRVHAHVRAERDALERMRASGEVPRRPTVGAPAALATTAAK